MSEAVPFFKKKAKGRPTTSRRRSVSPSASTPDTASTSTVVHPTKKSASNLLSTGTKRSLTSREKDELELDVDYKDDDGPDVKWGASDKKSHRDQVLEILAGDEAEELLAKRRKVEGTEDNEDANDDGQYHGQKAYRQHLKKSKEIPKAMRVGPQRSTNTIRTVTIIDYQPDVCKDYKGKLFIRSLFPSSSNI
jgi:RING finger protein 113A